MQELAISEDEAGVTFMVRVSPRAARAKVLGVHDGALKLSITAPPVDGAANTALIAFFSKALAVPKGAVEIASGERGRNKRIRVSGIHAIDVNALLP